MCQNEYLWSKGIKKKWLILSTYDTQLPIFTLFHAVRISFTEFYRTLFAIGEVMGDSVKQKFSIYWTFTKIPIREVELWKHSLKKRFYF